MMMGADSSGMGATDPSGSPLCWRLQNTFLNLCDEGSMWGDVQNCRTRTRSADSYVAGRVSRAWSCTIPMSPPGHGEALGGGLATPSVKGGPSDLQYGEDGSTDADGGTRKSTMEDESLDGGRAGESFDDTTGRSATDDGSPGGGKSTIMSEVGSVDADQHTPTLDSWSTTSPTQAHKDTRPPRGGATADESVVVQSDCWRYVTTVMLRNLPSNFSQDDVADVLNTNGLKGKYDFIYLPRVHQHQARRKQSNFGYVFINFLVPEFAEACRYIFDGRPVIETSLRLTEVIPANIQGRENLCRNFNKKFRKNCGPWMLAPDTARDGPGGAQCPVDSGSC